jgi:hypothetical protein
MIKKYLEFLTHKYSGEIFKPKRDEYEVLDQEVLKKHPELSDEFFDLIKIAYYSIGGNAKIKSPDDLFNDPNINYWGGIDLHDTSDYDIIVFGKKTKFGIKIAAGGHDGEVDSKRRYLEEFNKKINSYGFYTEVSDKFGKFIMKYLKVPLITSQEEVEKVLNKKVNWIGEYDGHDGWYERKIGDVLHKKFLIGNPIIN